MRCAFWTALALLVVVLDHGGLGVLFVISFFLSVLAFLLCFITLAIIFFFIQLSDYANVCIDDLLLSF